ncbi:MAG: HAD family phosphatase [Candidatus Levybacteria bacterium]|nr:HAD family phosphatase [Candidatus Levybacteria bacterium]
MDGVLIDSESAWVPFQDAFSTSLFGLEIYKKVGASVGITINDIYKKASRFGFSMNMDQYYSRYDQQAIEVYKNAKPTKEIKKLVTFLKHRGFKIGLVSSSRKTWIKFVLNKLDLEGLFDDILSINDEKIESKPKPTAYSKIINKLGVKESQAIVLEDTNNGINSAKKAGAIVIGFQENIPNNYIQKNADYYAINVNDVINVVNRLIDGR